MFFALAILTITPLQAVAPDDEMILAPDPAIQSRTVDAQEPVLQVSFPVVQALPVEKPLETRSVEAAVYRPEPESFRQNFRREAQSGFSSSDLHCLAMAVYFEARGEPLSGQKAVADVVMNRKKRRSLPSVCSVVNQPGQFSGRSRWKAASGPNWDRAVAIARDSLSGVTHVSSSIQFFHSTAVSPNWGRKSAMRIGAHIFY